MILSEVALGKQYERVNAENVTQGTLNTKKCNSTKGIGKYVALEENADDIDNVKIPMGPLKMINKTNTLLYNEHIVYNTNAFLVKYLALVKNVGGQSNY